MKDIYWVIGIIAILIIYILMLVFFHDAEPKGVFSTLSAKEFACKELAKSRCEVSTYTILMNKCPYEICFDANKDGKVDYADTFQALCESYFDIASRDETACKKLCECP